MFKRREPYKPLQVMRIRHVLIFAAALLPLGCIVEAPTASSAQPGAGPIAVPQRAAAAVQPMQVKVGANLGDKLELVGAIIDPGVVTPGLPAKVTLFFKVLATVPEDWMVFV